MILDKDDSEVADCFGSTIGSANATATEFVRRWNSHDALLVACELYQERIELFRKMNPSIVIALGSGLGLKQAEDKGKAAIAEARE